MRPLVEPPIACSTTCALRNDAAVRNSLGRGPFAFAIAAATLPLASAERKRSACGAGMVALIGSDRPSASVMQAMVRGGAHHHAGADRRREPAVDGFDLDIVDFTGAVFAPQPAAIGAGAQHFALVMADHHRPDRE